MGYKNTIVQKDLLLCNFGQKKTFRKEWVVKFRVIGFKLFRANQGCQILLSTTYQNDEKYTNWTQNRPNGHM
jgi:hypothetical protein